MRHQTPPEVNYNSPHHLETSMTYKSPLSQTLIHHFFDKMEPSKQNPDMNMMENYPPLDTPMATTMAGSAAATSQSPDSPTPFQEIELPYYGFSNAPAHVFHGPLLPSSPEAQQPLPEVPIPTQLPPLFQHLENVLSWTTSVFWLTNPACHCLYATAAFTSQCPPANLRPSRSGSGHHLSPCARRGFLVAHDTSLRRGAAALAPSTCFARPSCQLCDSAEF